MTRPSSATAARSSSSAGATADAPGSLPSVMQVIGRFERGGAQRLAVNLADALAEIGASSCGVALRSAEVSGRGAGGAALFALGQGEGSVLGLARTAAAMRRLVHERRPDVVHVHGAGCLPLAAVAIRGLRPRPRLCFTWHDSSAVLAERGVRRRLMLWALSRCDAIFGSSASVAERLSAVLDGRRKIGVFENGVPGLDVPDRRSSEVCRVVWVGRFVPEKDPQILLRAASRLAREGVPFRVILAGSAPPRLEWYLEQTRALVKELGLEDRVDMPGWLDDPRAMLLSSDVGVQTSHTEGLSLALLEQMMAGLAIVATDVGDTRVALDGGRCGTLIPARDEAALAAGLRELIENAPRRRGVAALARERAMDRYSTAAMAERAIEAYAGLEPCA